MSYFEASVRVPLMVHYPKRFQPRRVPENVSTLDILPTLVDLVGLKLNSYLPIDGTSLMPQLQGMSSHDTVFAEYCGEGTISPMMMIRRGPWKYITCPADPPQLFNLKHDPLELKNLAQAKKIVDASGIVSQLLEDFAQEAAKKWEFQKISDNVRASQRQRRFVWAALKQGKFTSWDYDPIDDGREKYFLCTLFNKLALVDRHRYIRSHVPLDDLELRARFPAVDAYGRETRPLRHDQAGSNGQ
jgi:arylsulfatase A-like enzyme